MSSTNAIKLIERLETLKPKLIAGDDDAQKEASVLSRMLTASVNEPKNVAVELAFSVNIPLSLVALSKLINKAVCGHECEGCSGFTLVRTYFRGGNAGYYCRVGFTVWRRRVIDQ